MAMNPTCSSSRRETIGASLVLVCLALAWFPTAAEARPNIREAFFTVYPNAVGSKLDNLPSKAGHCAVCHYDVNGGGAKNPYGDAILASGKNLNKTQGRISAVETVANLDSDADNFTTQTEVTGVGYANTPTFPGLSNANVGLVVGVPTLEVSPYVTPTTVVDNTPPTVALLTPNGSESLTANAPFNLTWTASDASGIAGIHLYLSIDNGATYTPLAFGLENTGTYSWFPANRPTTTALIRVIAIDGATNAALDTSDAVFTIVSPPGGLVPTTLRDFDMPGSQPFEGGAEPSMPANCGTCHGNFNPAVEPYQNWRGSLMALASRDPLFEANMAIANQDAPDSGDLCLRCHISGGWLQGRSVPTSGGGMLETDKVGVSCDLCHRMVDPNYVAGVNPAREAEVLADLSFPGTEYGLGMFVVDPSGIQRGPFADAAAPHNFLASSFHRRAAFCGTCHDVSNPAFTKDANGVYQPNTLDAHSTNFSPHSAGPVERTYSEWLNSTYNSTGVYAPQFAGNKADGVVSTCQDCHLRDVSGYGCNPATNPGVPLRADLPLHDMTGGSTWIQGVMAALYPAQIDAAAVQSSAARATSMLQNAATVATRLESGQLVVRVTNQTGHKLPTGYPEGRRIWVNARFFDAGSTLIAESAAYDAGTGVLAHDPQAKVYEVHPGIDTNISGLVGIPAGPSLHFVLNNKIYHDNRIPPRGFTNAAFAQFGGAPVGHSYADGQYWDETAYNLPAGTRRVEVRLYYQSTSKEFVEFLRDQNTTNTKGQEMYDVWNANGKCPPLLMASAEQLVTPPVFAGLASATPGIESATLAWAAATTAATPVTYRVYVATTSGTQDFDNPLLETGSLGTVVAALDPGISSPLNYYFVVRAVDANGVTDDNTVEMGVTPWLDPTKDQDGDCMPNGFETAHGLDPFFDDAASDTDCDGLAALEEYAFGSDPTTSASANRPLGQIVPDGGNTYLALVYVRRQGLPPPTIVVEVSGDLGTWTSGPAASTIHSTADNGDGTETVVERMTTTVESSPRAFMRIGVLPE